MTESMATIPTKQLIAMAEQNALNDILASENDELQFKIDEMQKRLDDYKMIDVWLTATPWNRESFKKWLAEQGLDDQTVEIERLNGENEELRRAIDELGAQVEYWRAKAGVEDGQLA